MSKCTAVRASSMRLPLIGIFAFAIAFSTGTRAQEIDLIDPFPNLVFASPINDFQHADDGTNMLYLAERAGVIRSFENDASTTSTTTFLDITDRVLEESQGLLGLAFHPDHENNGFFFVNYLTTGSLRTRLSRFRRSAFNPDMANPASEVILLEVFQPNDEHNGGQIAFGPDGYLYVAGGDGGHDGPGTHGQNPTTLLGSILRLDVNGGGNPLDCGAGTGSATIPADNPLVDGPGNNCDEIYAYGFREVWRMSFDPVTGDLLAADGGANSWEEIDDVAAGGNYGWEIYESNSCNFPPCDPTGMTFPIWEYSHSADEFAIIGGYTYRGVAIPELFGKYVYGDLGGQIWSLDTSPITPLNEEIASIDDATHCVGPWCLITFGVDQAGELYLITIQNQIRKLIPVSPVTLSCTPIGDPIVIPAGGGSYAYDIEIVNNGTTAETFDIWLDIDGPGVDETRGPIMRTLAAGASLMRTLNQNIPGGAPAGDYMHTCNLGTFPIADASSSFDWEKSAVFAPGGASVADWSTEAEIVAALAAIPGEAPAESPNEFMLDAAYPNPFNPHTTIRFGLPEPAQVRLVVYDVLGRLVRVLLDGTRVAGTHEVVFDANDLPSGTYLYRLETPQGSFVRTMLLAK